MATDQRVTELVVLSEQAGLGTHITEMMVLSEMGALGLYVTSLIILSELEDVILDGYAVGIGHDLPTSFIYPIIPQFTTEGMKITRRSFSQNKKLQDEFLYVEFLFSSLGTRERYRSVLSQFDLLTNDEANVTVYLRDKTLRWRRANAVAVRPLQNEDIEYNFFPQNIVILIKEIEFLD